MFDAGKLAFARIATDPWMVIALALIEPTDTLSLLAPVRVGTIVASDKVGLLDIVDAINLCLGKTARRNHLPMHIGDVPTTRAEASVLSRLTQYPPQTDFRHAIAKFIALFRECYRK